MLESERSIKESFDSLKESLHFFQYFMLESEVLDSLKGSLHFFPINYVSNFDCPVNYKFVFKIRPRVDVCQHAHLGSDRYVTETD